MFQDLRGRGQKALVLFVTAGDPDLAQLLPILNALAEGGADIIEVGLPFSDPIADGPTIQAASQRALDRGATTAKIFQALEGFQGPPIVFMGYYNPILKMGPDVFAAQAKNAGGAANIVCDLTAEEADQWCEASQHHGLDTVFLAAPTSTDERLDGVCQRSTGFVYAVSRTGVTGSNPSGETESENLVARLRERTKTPVCVGFGVRTPDDVREVCRFADGAVIGSWLVDFLAHEWKAGEGRERLVSAVKALKAATLP